jgi:hypothetical protein
LVFQYHIPRIKPSATVHRRAGFTGITFHYLQFERALGIPFTTTNTNSVDVQGVSIPTASSMDVQGISLSTASSMNVQGVSLYTASSMEVQGVSLSTSSSSMDMQGVPLF